MKSISTNKSHRHERDWEAFLFSILLHVFIFTSFTFIFKNFITTKKPNLIFLGPILGYDEIRRIENHRTPQDTKDFLLAEMDVHPRGTDFFAEGNTANNKVLPPAKLKQGTKNYLKNTFLKKDGHSQIREKELEKLGIDPDIPRRVPLRLSY